MTAAVEPVRGRRLWELAVLACSTLYIAVYTWPASIQPAAWVWGSHGDGLGNIVEFSWFVQAIQQGRAWNVDPNLAIPFGENLGSLPHEPLYFWTQVAIGLVAGSVVALNLISMIAVPAAAWAMYRLVLFITRSPIAGFVGGIGFGCSSYVLINTRGEPTLAQIWIFPAVALALLRMTRRPDVWNAALVVVALTASALTNFYYVLFVALASVALMLGWLAFTTLERRALPVRQLLTGLAAGVTAVVVTIGLYEVLVGHLAERAARIHRTTSSLAALAPSPIDLVLPPRSNPWVGFWRQQLFEVRLAHTGAFTDFGELSIAASILLLAVIGLIFIALRRSSLVRSGVVARAEVVAVLAVSALGAWLLVPPFVLQHRRLWFLSLQWDIFSVAPQYASFYRAGNLILFGACVLAGVGVAAIALRYRRAAGGIAVLAVIVVFGENFMLPSDRVLAVESPPEYTWISQHPGDYAIADYPLLPTNSGANEYTAEFNQRFHGHPLLNGHINGTESESMREELRDPNRGGVPGVLAALGVRYVVWHPDLIDQIAPLLPKYAAQLRGYQPQPPGYQLESSFSDGSSVYAVAGAPVGAFAFYAAGFGSVTTQGPGGWARHPDLADAQIDVYSASATAVALSFICVSTVAPVTLTAGGQVTGLGPDETTLSLPVQARQGITATAIRFSSDSATVLAGVACSTIAASPG